MLTDPETALADHNDMALALTGLVGLARLVHALAAGPRRHADQPADDFIHLLLGVVYLGDAADKLAGPTPEANPSEPPGPPRVWLR